LILIVINRIEIELIVNNNSAFTVRKVLTKPVIIKIFKTQLFIFLNNQQLRAQQKHSFSFTV